ncbi:MAG: hypothetical protein ABSH48_24430 [Verrucomicrobiota bacterium]
MKTLQANNRHTVLFPPARATSPARAGGWWQRPAGGHLVTC